MMQQHHTNGKGGVRNKMEGTKHFNSFSQVRFSHPAEGVFSSLLNLKSAMGIRLSAEQNTSLKNLS